MTDFLNPYQFIPVTGQINGTKTPVISYENLAANQIRHDYWQEGRFSGRVVCSLELLTPTVVGNQQTAAEPAQVEPYLDGQAIPANSLRGMVAALAEALSQSAMRVLQPAVYFVRKDMSESLSALGQLQIDESADGSRQYYIKPLCLPTLAHQPHGKYPEQWRKLLGDKARLVDWLPAYVHGYQSGTSNGFLAAKNPACFHGEHPQYYYAKLSALNTSMAERINLGAPGLYVKRAYLLGQRIQGQSNQQLIISEVKYRTLSATEQVGYTRGILHVLGVAGREQDIPNTKKHEKFIPVPEAKQQQLKALKIDARVINDFMAVARQCAADSKNQLPFLPQGYRELSNNKKHFWEPGNGELLYFKLDQNGQVSEISYSSIWRKKIAGDCHGAFAAINANLLPWGTPLRKPTQAGVGLTPAECLFGVVEREKTIPGPKSYNLASRLRFTDAKAATTIVLPEEAVLLKILASPKPPSPAMYFKNDAGAYIAKHTFNLTRHQPNGRKVYLHHTTASIKNQPWETTKPQDNIQQKLACKPLPVGSRFYFHIDFNNLGQDELSLLLTALQPDQDFCHRLGLGKPLGLGSVKLNIAGLFFIDRRQRYTSLGLATPRYSQWHDNFIWPDDEVLNLCYPQEKACLSNPQFKTVWRPSPTYIDNNTLKTLKIVGNRANQTIPVSYPFTDVNAQVLGGESEGFKWFQQNSDENNRPQVLAAINLNTGSLPRLNSKHGQPDSTVARGKTPNQHHNTLADKSVTARLKLLGLPADLSAEEKAKQKQQIINHFINYQIINLDWLGSTVYLEMSKADLEDALKTATSPPLKILNQRITILKEQT